jgi:rhodanese-related sulfurtransferase
VLAVTGGLLPLVAYWMLLGRSAVVTAGQAKEILAEREPAAALVDVRTPEEFAAGRIEAARNWPYQEIAALRSAESIPEDLRGKRLLLLCESGVLSALATQHLSKIGIWNATNVHGGMQAWVATAEKPCALALCRLRSGSGEVEGLPSRPSPPLEEWAAVLTGFLIKPLYTLLALVLAVILWRQHAPDLLALRWAMLCFFVGEDFCAANYLFGSDQSLLLEYFHSYGMVLCFGLTTYALLEGIDQRLIKLSDPQARCAALGLCHRCIKHADVPCGLRRVFLFLIPAMIIIALAPLSAALVPVSYNTTIFGTFYNYSHPVLCQIFETRYLPATAVVLFTTSLGILRYARKNPVLWSKVFFSAGFGAIGFSFFRLLVFHAYRDNLVWFGAWEEVTELLFILGVGLVLWVFRAALLPELTAILTGRKVSLSAGRTSP